MPCSWVDGLHVTSFVELLPTEYNSALGNPTIAIFVSTPHSNLQINGSKNELGENGGDGKAYPLLVGSI